MKATLTGLFIIVSYWLYGQPISSQNCGLDDNPILNDYEAAYFNDVFKSSKGDFDFRGKMVGFYKGPSGNTRSTKSDYFSGLDGGNGAENNRHLWQAGGTQLLMLTDEEKELSGGYDVILVSWSKLRKEGKSRMKLVRRLKGTLPGKR